MLYPSWELFPHSADIGIRGFGRTLPEAFEQAALALTGVVTEEQVGDAAEYAHRPGQEATPF